MLKDFFGIFSWAVGSNIWIASFSWFLSKGYPRVQQEVWSRSPVSALPRGERAIQSWLLPLFQPNFKSCGNPSLWIHFQANRFRQMCGQSHSEAEPLRDHHHHFHHRHHHYNHHAFNNSYTHPHTMYISHLVNSFLKSSSSYHEYAFPNTMHFKCCPLLFTHRTRPNCNTATATTTIAIHDINCHPDLDPQHKRQRQRPSKFCK